LGHPSNLRADCPTRAHSQMDRSPAVVSGRQNESTGGLLRRVPFANSCLCPNQCVCSDAHGESSISACRQGRFSCVGASVAARPSRSAPTFVGISGLRPPTSRRRRSRHRTAPVGADGCKYAPPISPRSSIVTHPPSRKRQEGSYRRPPPADTSHGRSLLRTPLSVCAA